MGSEEIVFIIAADGRTVEVQAHGFTGPACQEATRPYEEALGIVTADTPAADLHKAAAARKDAHASTRRPR